MYINIYIYNIDRLYLNHKMFPGKGEVGALSSNPPHFSNEALT